MTNPQKEPKRRNDDEGKYLLKTENDVIIDGSFDTKEEAEAWGRWNNFGGINPYKIALKTTSKPQSEVKCCGCAKPTLDHTNTSKCAYCGLPLRPVSQSEINITPTHTEDLVTGEEYPGNTASQFSFRPPMSQSVEGSYHAIERVLNDFKNGATYSDSIEKIQAFLSSTLSTLVKKMEGKKKDLKWFEDNYFTAENAYPSYDKVNDRWVGVTAKDCFNAGISAAVEVVKKIV